MCCCSIQSSEDGVISRGIPSVSDPGTAPSTAPRNRIPTITDDRRTAQQTPEVLVDRIPQSYTFSGVNIFTTTAIPVKAIGNQKAPTSVSTIGTLQPHQADGGTSNGPRCAFSINGSASPCGLMWPTLLLYVLIRKTKRTFVELSTT